ncbi:hypothetical protein [Streptosporangium roseum]
MTDDLMPDLVLQDLLAILESHRERLEPMLCAAEVLTDPDQ